jgi:hypothetical protein
MMVSIFSCASPSIDLDAFLSQLKSFTYMGVASKTESDVFSEPAMIVSCFCGSMCHCFGGSCVFGCTFFLCFTIILSRSVMLKPLLFRLFIRAIVVNADNSLLFGLLQSSLLIHVILSHL